MTKIGIKTYTSYKMMGTCQMSLWLSLLPGSPSSPIWISFSHPTWQYCKSHQEKQPHSLNWGHTLFVHMGWGYSPGAAHTTFSRCRHDPPNADEDRHPDVIAHVAKTLQEKCDMEDTQKVTLGNIIQPVHSLWPLLILQTPDWGLMAPLAKQH